MNWQEQYVAFMTILRKEVRRYLRIWTQTLLPSAITMSLYFVIFGSLIGSRIGEMGGFTYMQFGARNQDRARPVITKIEYSSRGANLRYMVTKLRNYAKQIYAGRTAI